MANNCIGCKTELEIAYDYQNQGHYIATAKKFPNSYPAQRSGHYALLIVNDKGKIIVY